MQPARTEKYATRKGFTIIEGVLSMVLGAAILAGISSFAIGIRNFRSETQVTGTVPFDVDNRPYSTIPSRLGFEVAVQYHFVLQQLIDSASAVYVFGGRGETFLGDPLLEPGDPTNDEDLGPMVIGGEPDIGAVVPIDTSEMPLLSTCHGMRVLLEDNLMIQFENEVRDTGDFTMMTVTDLGQITGIAQVRRAPNIQASDDRQRIFYFASLDYDPEFAPATIPLSAEAVALDPNQVPNRVVYRCAVEMNEETDETPLGVGAAHFWFREDTQWLRYEQAAARVVFPDPLMLQATDDDAGFSRFSYFQSIQQ